MTIKRNKEKMRKLKLEKNLLKHSKSQRSQLKHKMNKRSNRNQLNLSPHQLKTPLLANQKDFGEKKQITQLLKDNSLNLYLNLRGKKRKMIRKSRKKMTKSLKVEVGEIIQLCISPIF